MTSPSSPPRARLAFRVGVVGHRPDRLPTDEDGLAALRERISTVLEAARQAVATFQAQSPDARFYAPEPPLMRAISPLADGSDRIFAEEAMGLGYGLCCPMPFHQEEYEKDLTPESLTHFRALLEQARQGAGLTTFELDGERTEDGSGGAYGAAGRVVLNQSDLLVVVWDGMEAHGAGAVRPHPGGHRGPPDGVDVRRRHGRRGTDAGAQQRLADLGRRLPAGAGMSGGWSTGCWPS